MVDLMSTSSPFDPMPFEVVGPDVSSIVTEDDAPVDNIYSEKQQRLLTEPLYSGWEGPPLDESGEARPFVAMANVGLFTTTHQPPTVPDVLVSLDVTVHDDVHIKEHRTYFVWEFGKVPDVVIEVVSNREGGELTDRKRRYRQMRVTHYVVWDPEQHLGEAKLQVFELRGQIYSRVERPWFQGLGLGLVEWKGEYERLTDTWLRWCDAKGEVIPTGAERAMSERARAETEKARAETEKVRAEAEKARAESEKARAERLAEKLRALGIDPDA